MAREIYRFGVTIPAGTLSTAPQITDLTMPSGRIVRRIQVVVPSGPRGEVGFQLGFAGQNVIPVNRGAFVTPENEVITWETQGYPDSGAWQCIAFNTGNFAHTLEFRFEVDLVGSQSTAPAIPADQLVPLAGGAPGGFDITTGGLPGVPLPPLPPPPPPISLPPLSPPPGLPPLPGLPSPPGSPPGAPRVTRPLPTRMYDSTTAGDIPGDAVAIAFYDYVPSSRPSVLNPDRFYVVITKDPSHTGADAFDVEAGAGDVDGAYAWGQAKAGSARPGMVYGIGQTHDQLTQMIAYHGGHPIARWLAEWDGDPTIPAGYVAKQYANSALTGGHYDLSSLSPGVPGLAEWASTIGPPGAGGGGLLRSHGGAMVTYDESTQTWVAVTAGTDGHCYMREAPEVAGLATATTQFLAGDDLVMVTVAYGGGFLALYGLRQDRAAAVKWRQNGGWSGWVTLTVAPNGSGWQGQLLPTTAP